MAAPLYPSDLADLKRLKEVWSGLKEVVLKCHAARKVGDEDGDHYDELLNQARVLYGRLQRIIGTAAIQQVGRTFDAFQHVLGQPSVYSIIHDRMDAYHWQQLWSAGDSAITQGIGRLEAKAREGSLALDTQTVARWAPIINLLEATRQSLSWLLSRPNFLAPFVERIEGSPLYRVISVATTFGSLILLFLLTLGGVGFLINYLR